METEGFQLLVRFLHKHHVYLIVFILICYLFENHCPRTWHFSSKYEILFKLLPFMKAKPGSLTPPSYNGDTRVLYSALWIIPEQKKLMGKGCIIIQSTPLLPSVFFFDIEMLPLFYWSYEFSFLGNLYFIYLFIERHSTLQKFF